MDKRTAKREACNRAGSLIRSALANGWETLDKYGEDGRPKVADALIEIAEELERRAGFPPDVIAEITRVGVEAPAPIVIPHPPVRA